VGERGGIWAVGGVGGDDLSHIGDIAVGAGSDAGHERDNGSEDFETHLDGCWVRYTKMYSDVGGKVGLRVVRLPKRASTLMEKRVIG